MDGWVPADRVGEVSLQRSKWESDAEEAAHAIADRESGREID